MSLNIASAKQADLGQLKDNIYIKALVNEGNWAWDTTKTGGALHWYLDPAGWTPAQYASMHTAVKNALDAWAGTA